MSTLLDAKRQLHTSRSTIQTINLIFQRFFRGIFPDVHQHIDFTVFTDLFNGKSKKADIVIETKLKGTESRLIIHVEPQSYTQPEFHERMHHYFSLLYNKVKLISGGVFFH